MNKHEYQDIVWNDLKVGHTQVSNNGSTKRTVSAVNEAPNGINWLEFTDGTRDASGSDEVKILDTIHWMGDNLDVVLAWAERFGRPLTAYHVDGQRNLIVLDGDTAGGQHVIAPRTELSPAVGGTGGDVPFSFVEDGSA